MLRLISTITLLLSTFVVLLYYSPFLKYRWFFALLLELFPYLSSIAFFAFLLVLILPSLRQQRVRVAIAMLLLVLCWAPILNWVGRPQPPLKLESLRVMAYNLWIDNPKTDAIEQAIRHEAPDIVFLSEISQTTTDTLTEQLDYPYSYRATGGNNALFSHYPILEAITDDFGVKAQGRPLSLVAKLRVGNEIVTVIGVHPPVPIFRQTFYLRNQHLDALSRASQRIDGKLIVLGDFNTTPWSPYLERFERHSQLQNAGRGQGIWATWYFNQSLEARYIKIPIDHIMSRGVTPLKTWTGMTGGSDHKPLITVFKL